ncbi:hypothetical protein ACJIZ3_019226 [Penstemon smallii]|uniref:DUF674 domain-containing protein n=1 Tax=Penstemon smallii TaxID=265156 RepID=A0ABD3T0J7_9LAMI
MSTAKEEVTLSLTAMINKEKTNVLFALVDNNLADIFLSYLALPMGLIIQLLKQHYGDEAPNMGSLNSLYNGLANLDSAYFWTEAGKLMLLNPKNSLEKECSKLKINLNKTQPTKYFTCGYWPCSGYRNANASMYHNTNKCPSCGSLMNREIDVVGKNSTHGDGEVFVVKPISFLITHDMKMLPNVTGSIFESIKYLGITDADEAEARSVVIGLDEVMHLLKGLLSSQATLADIVFKKLHMHHSPTTKFESFNLPPEMKKGTTSSSKKMKVNAMVQKSNNKLLFVQAKEEFVEFLFSLLTIPLGQVESLLGGDTSLGEIDNFYRSIVNLDGDRYLTLGAKGMLIKPKLPPKYLSKYQIFPISEQKAPDLYYYIRYYKGIEHLSPYKSEDEGTLVSWVYSKNLQGEVSFVKGPGMFMVTDDLTVTPLCMVSTLSTLKERKITLSDVEELELDIGLEECLSILKSSLISSNSLTNGLIHVLKKQPKQEH